MEERGGQAFRRGVRQGHAETDGGRGKRERETGKRGRQVVREREGERHLE